MRTAVSVAIFITTLSPVAFAQVIPEPPRLLNPNGISDSGDDQFPAIATDKAGVWVVCWESTETLGDTVDADSDIFFSRSTDNGDTWSPPLAMNSNATTDTGDDRDVTIATDESGNWIAIWESDDTLDDTIGNDFDLFYAVSTDNGETWSNADTLNTNANTDIGDDINAALATDAAGNWMVVWNSDSDVKGTAGTDTDILFSTTTDVGTTWTAPAVPNDVFNTDSGIDQNPDIATNRSGRWIIVWESTQILFGSQSAQQSNGDIEIATTTSANFGTSWTTPVTIDFQPLMCSGFDGLPTIAADTASRFRTIWESTENIFDVLETDRDLFFGRTNDGTSWLNSPGFINQFAPDDRNIQDRLPDIATDDAGNFAFVWSYSGDSMAPVDGDGDIFIRHSSDAFDSNIASDQILNINATIDEGRDFAAVLAAGSAGRWIAAWHSDSDVGGSGDQDNDILFAPFEIGLVETATISGTVRDQNGDPVTCAVVEFVAQGSSATVAGSTNLRGEYLVEGLENNVHDVSIYAPGIGVLDVGFADTLLGSVAELNFDISPVNQVRTLSGRVTDATTGEPLVTVLVEALFPGTTDDVRARTYTCASGDYVLPLSFFKGTSIADIRFTLINYDTKTIGSVFVPFEGTEINETLDKAVGFPSSLTGTVTRAFKGAGSPVVGAQITVQGETNQTVFTDVMGIYTFDAILGGSYVIAVSADGFDSRFISRAIGDSEVAVQDVQLGILQVEEVSEPADVNDDGSVNSQDIQTVINVVLGTDTSGADADVNDDNSVNSQDIQSVINTVLGI